MPNTAASQHRRRMALRVCGSCGGAADEMRPWGNVRVPICRACSARLDGESCIHTDGKVTDTVTNHWPKWATVRAENVRTELAPDDRGPWEDGKSCIRSLPREPHKAELPYFFHCHRCMEGIRRVSIVKPHPRRDLGLCMRCGRKAEDVRDVVRGDPVAAAIAENRGITIARLGTRARCKACDALRKLKGR